MKLSLRTKVSLVLVIFVGFGGALTSYFLYTNSNNALKTSTGNNLSYTADQTMDKIDRFLYERSVDVQSLAGRQQLQDFLILQPSERNTTDISRLNNQLDEFKNSSGTWSEITIIDNKGALALPSAHLQNLSAQLSKQPSILKAYSAAASGHISYSDAVSLSKGQEPIMVFLAPIRNPRLDGQPIIGVMVGELAWQANLDILRSLKNTKATLVNSKGLSLGNNKPNAERDVLSLNLSDTQAFKQSLIHNDGIGVYPGIDDPHNTYLTVYVKENGYLEYRGNNWRLVLATPTSTAFASAHSLAKTLIVIFVSILILSVVAFILVLERLVIKPITVLKKATDKLSGGDFSEPISVKSTDEIGQLSQAFNFMAAKLQDSVNGLQLRTEQAEDEGRRTETILDNLPVGVIVVRTSDGKPLLINHTAVRLSGHTKDDLMKSGNFNDAVKVVQEDGTTYPLANRPLTIAAHTGETVIKDDLFVERPDGSLMAIRSMATPIFSADGTYSQIASVFEDISKDLELERSREEFFSIASHELRTPLTAIRGNSDMIQQFYGDQLTDPDLKEMVSDIHESSLRLIGIVNDFLDTSRLEQKRMKFELAPIDLLDNAKSVIKEYQVTGSRQKVEVEVKPPSQPLPKVLADNNRVKQVLINLVGNALKFTNDGNVFISFSTEQEGFVKVLVSDTGQGMDEDAQKLLFKKFEQTGATVITRDSVRGTGLGLYISKLIVEQMKGHIKLESSKPGVGTTFSFTLPIASQQASKEIPGEEMIN